MRATRARGEERSPPGGRAPQSAGVGEATVPGGLKGRTSVAPSEARSVAERPLSERSEDMSLSGRERGEGFRDPLRKEDPSTPSQRGEGFLDSSPPTQRYPSERGEDFQDSSIAAATVIASERSENVPKSARPARSRPARKNLEGLLARRGDGKSLNRSSRKDDHTMSASGVAWPWRRQASEADSLAPAAPA